MVNLILTLLASLGLTFILKQGRILNEIRSFIIKLHPLLKDLFSCAMCLGFWSGLFIGILSQYDIISIILIGFASSFLGFITQTLITVLEYIFEKS